MLASFIDNAIYGGNGCVVVEKQLLGMFLILCPNCGCKAKKKTDVNWELVRGNEVTSILGQV